MKCQNLNPRIPGLGKNWGYNLQSWDWKAAMGKHNTTITCKLHLLYCVPPHKLLCIITICI
jgi:hypothetical protein